MDILKVELLYNENGELLNKQLAVFVAETGILGLAMDLHSGFPQQRLDGIGKLEARRAFWGCPPGPAGVVTGGGCGQSSFWSALA